MSEGELRAALVKRLRPWLWPDDGGHLYKERMATQQAERIADDLLAGPLRGLVGGE